MKLWVIIKMVLTIILGIVVIGLIIWQTLRKSDDPARMAFKWVLTAVVLVFLYFQVGPMMAAGGGEAGAGLALTLVCGLVLAITWRVAIASLIAKPFAALYDGGDIPPEPRPAYSVAIARRKQGNPAEAVAEIQMQLERFPTDFEGHMLM